MIFLQKELKKYSKDLIFLKLKRSFVNFSADLTGNDGIYSAYLIGLDINYRGKISENLLANDNKMSAKFIPSNFGNYFYYFFDRVKTNQTIGRTRLPIYK